VRAGPTRPAVEVDRLADLRELRDRYEQFKRRDLYEIRLVALFLDATFIAVRPDGPKEGVLVAWGFTEEGERVLLSVTLGMRESYEDWQALGRDLIARGLGAPMLIVADGAPGLIKAIEQCWPASDRQRCCVHRARNLYAKLPERERERVKQAYWRALDDAISPSDASSDSKPSSTSSTRAATPLRQDASPTTSTRSSCTCATRRGIAAAGGQRICSSAPFGEVKQRTKVMGRFPGEESCLTLVWAVLDLLITHQTNGIHFNQLDRQRLKRTRYEGTEQTTPEEVTAA
jgi:putative transposase